MIYLITFEVESKCTKSTGYKYLHSFFRLIYTYIFYFENESHAMLGVRKSTFYVVNCLLHKINLFSIKDKLEIKHSI